MDKLLLATNNIAKLREIEAILANLPVELITPTMIGLKLDVPEDGATYAENASLKALAFARLAGLISLADDSGLEVQALEGLPGVRSARFAPQPGATDADRRHYLLEQLHGKPTPWKALFRCTVALASPDGEVRFAEGVCPGMIIPEERGHNGFGYDPIFLLPELGLTMAELISEEKNRLSHRSRALRAAEPALLELLAKKRI
jgi:XTP/dITP diphosphohydrolase